MESCAKDDTTTKIPISIKIDCLAVPDKKSDLIPVNIPGQVVYYTYSRLIVRGAGRYLGKIDAEKSFYVIKSIEFFTNDVGLQYIRNLGEGKVVGTNGDGFEFTFWSVESLDNFKIVGELKTILETGTGIFEGCSGTLNIVGSANNKLWLCVDGYLFFE